MLLGAAAATTAAAYIAASRRDVDGTTEIAALVVMAAGVTAGIGAYRLASGIIAITSLLLVEKSRLAGTDDRRRCGRFRAAASLIRSRHKGAASRSRTSVAGEFHIAGTEVWIASAG